MNTISYFEIHSENPEKAADFYKTIFGWEFHLDPVVPIEYYRMTNTGKMFGGILRRKGPIPPREYGMNGFVCSIEVEDFNDMSAKIVANGGMIAVPQFPITGRCWNGYFADLDYNIFGIYQVDPTAK